MTKLFLPRVLILIELQKTITIAVEYYPTKEEHGCRKTCFTTNSFVRLLDYSEKKKKTEALRNFFKTKKIVVQAEIRTRSFSYRFFFFFEVKGCILQSSIMRLLFFSIIVLVCLDFSVYGVEWTHTLFFFTILVYWRLLNVSCTDKEWC